jgi:hypothetical protein
MVAKASGIDSVVVRVVPSAPSASRDASGFTSSGDEEPGRRAYDALVYSRLPLRMSQIGARPAGQPDAWGGEPLVGVETFVVNWARYSEYASAYYEGEKAAASMQDRLFEVLPENLRMTLGGELGGSRPSRTWFHSDAPEVSQLPWELVAYASGHRLATSASFVRGIPPDAAIPLVPVVGNLRLGVIDPGGRVAPAFRQVLTNVGTDLEVIPFGGGVRAALSEAVGRGCELLHVVAGASVTASYDGVLEFPGSEEPPIASREVAYILRGSRVRLVGLTPPTQARTVSPTRPYLVPSAYQAFTYFAMSPSPLPTFIVPVGPMDDELVVGFWTAFYQALATSFEIEGAVLEAQLKQLAPVGLFLRQLQAAAFRRVSEVERPDVEPSLVGAELAASTELLQQFEQLGTSLGVKTPGYDKLVKKERARQSKLQADVSEWIEGVDEE